MIYLYTHYTMQALAMYYVTIWNMYDNWAKNGCQVLTLSLRDCSTLGTSGKTSYNDDTYVITDFSSGSWTSTSATRGKKRGFQS